MTQVSTPSLQSRLPATFPPLPYKVAITALASALCFAEIGLESQDRAAPMFLTPAVLLWLKVRRNGAVQLLYVTNIYSAQFRAQIFNLNELIKPTIIIRQFRFGKNAC